LLVRFDLSTAGSEPSQFGSQKVMLPVNRPLWVASS
jgi:hypothetical protein